MSLEFSVNRATAASCATDCVVVGAFADATFTPSAQAIDTAAGGALRALAARGDLDGKTGSILSVDETVASSMPSGAHDPSTYDCPLT